MHENSQLDDHQKLTYLRQAIQDPATTPLLNRSTTSPSQYEDLVTLLKETYNQKCLIYRHHTMSIVNCPSVSKGTHEELSQFVSTILHSVSCLKDAGQFEIGPFVTSILTYFQAAQESGRSMVAVHQRHSRGARVRCLSQLLETQEEDHLTCCPLHCSQARTDQGAT